MFSPAPGFSTACENGNSISCKITILKFPLGVFGGRFYLIGRVPDP